MFCVCECAWCGITCMSYHVWVWTSVSACIMLCCVCMILCCLCMYSVILCVHSYLCGCMYVYVHVCAFGRCVHGCLQCYILCWYKICVKLYDVAFVCMRCHVMCVFVLHFLKFDLLTCLCLCTYDYMCLCVDVMLHVHYMYTLCRVLIIMLI